ncbi:hypothetical protein P9X10_01410 [Bacillus cereus]|nr:hypothetical protein [Bacillus cereus]
MGMDNKDKELDSLKVLQEIELHKDYFEEENKVIKIVPSDAREGVDYFTTLYEISSCSVFGKNIRGKHLSIRAPFKSVSVVHLKPLEEFGVMPLENYYKDNKTLKVTLSDGEVKYLRDIQTISYLRYYVTLLNGEADSISREQVVNIQILDIVDGIVQEEREEEGMKNTKAQLDSIEIGKDYGKENKIIDISTKNGDFYVYGIQSRTSKSIVCTSLDYNNLHIRLGELIDISVRTRYDMMHCWGIISSHMYPRNEMYVLVTFKNEETVKASIVSHKDIEYYEIMELGGTETTKVNCSNVIDMQVFSMSNDEPVSKASILLLNYVNKLSFDKDYTEEGRAIKVKTPKGVFHYKLVREFHKDSDSLLFTDLQGERQVILAEDIVYMSIEQISRKPKNPFESIEDKEVDRKEMKLEEIVDGKHYGKEDKIIRILTSIGCFLVYGIDKRNETSISCYSVNYNVVEICIKDITSIVMFDKLNLEKNGIEKDTHYSYENMYIEVTYKDGLTKQVDCVSHNDAEHFSFIDLDGNVEDVNSSELEGFALHDLETGEPLPKAILLLLNANIKIGVDYRDYEEYIHVKTNNEFYNFNKVIGIEDSGNVIVFEGVGEELESIQVEDITELNFLSHPRQGTPSTFFSTWGIEPNREYLDENKCVSVYTGEYKHSFAIIYYTESKSTIKGATVNNHKKELRLVDITDVVIEDLLKETVRRAKMVRNEKLTDGLKRVQASLNQEPSSEEDIDISDLFTPQDNVFKYYGVEEGKNYRKENKLIQVKLEDNVLVFTNLESDMEGWVAGRQFGSITTSIPVSKIKDMKIVGIEDLM